MENSSDSHNLSKKDSQKSVLVQEDLDLVNFYIKWLIILTVICGIATVIILWAAAEIDPDLWNKTFRIE